MEQLKEEPLAQEYVKEIEEIMERMDCPKDFRCYKSGLGNLCAAKDIGTDICLECLEDNPRDCKFSLCVGDSYAFGESRLCACPLRVFICKRLKR